MELNDLPQEIIYNIFLRLPTEFLLTLKIVCKVWQSMISDQDFVNAHLTKHRGDFHQIIVYRKSDVNPFESYYELSSNLQEVDFSTTKFSLYFSELKLSLKDDHLYLQSYCDGLLLFQSRKDLQKDLYEKQLYVCNPVTRKCTTLPVLKIDDGVRVWWWILIHDVSIQNYKVVGFGRYSNRCFIFTPHAGNTKQTSTTVAARWRELATPYKNYKMHSRQALVINNELHWLTSSDYCLYEDVMSSMDISTEEFRETRLSFLNERVYKGTSDIVEMMGSLCIAIYYCEKYPVDIWTLHDKNTTLWSKTYSITFDQIELGSVSLYSYPSITNSGDQAKFLIHDKKHIFVYDLKNKELKRIKFPMINSNLFMRSSFGHINSLVDSNIMIKPEKNMKRKNSLVDSNILIKPEMKMKRKMRYGPLGEVCVAIVVVILLISILVRFCVH